MKLTHLVARPLKSLAFHSPQSPTTRTVLYFFVFYVFLVQYCRITFYRDPTSFFFDPSRAYSPQYSAIRRAEADSFIANISLPTSLSTNPTSISKAYNGTLASKPKLCVGLATVAREGERYFKTTVGSLLQGLNMTERSQIHLKTLIAHTNPSKHPAYSEAWLWAVADDVLTYNLSAEELKHIEGLEKEKGLFREKALFDYRYLLEACGKTGSEYVVMVEDDVLAREGWYETTIKALGEVEKKTSLMGYSNWLYLRLFYTEEFFGWNMENWPTYLSTSSFLATLLLGTLLLLRRYLRPSAPLSNILTTPFILTLTLFILPLLILLFFACGRVSMLPLSPGVSLMPQYGCCSQSFVFPSSRISSLVDYYRDKRVGFVDMLTEELADDKGELRWALTPSVMQHVGGKSSKGDDFGDKSKWHRSVAEKLWNFEFERWRPGGEGRR